ncbi:SCO family protein [Sandaracinobacteroides saxicola]|uniref:SCO family protein n=1 Tax=Sandaracinobacteroides saxicola TaxID=2759707 RepID=A0A7G5IGA1_9SPHN|nr:SCO family protein [Sandaracinobacteroides saxicola]QMW22393.1 SCO family protein [Sandaracinobacteroides saxicola]
MNSRLPRLPLILLAAALLLLGGLWALRSMNPPVPAGNLAGASIGGPFTLVDGDGRTVTSATFDGRYRLMYFGYTFCPDVCPVDTAKLAAGYKAFETAEPKRAAQVQPMFVTVDPARDTPAVVKAFAAAFHPRLLGLSGSPEQVAAALKTFRVYANKVPGSAPDAYLVDHLAVFYLFGPKGEPIAFQVGKEATPETVAAMLKTYVR